VHIVLKPNGKYLSGRMKMTSRRMVKIERLFMASVKKALCDDALYKLT
jgi:hypothetical protein